MTPFDTARLRQARRLILAVADERPESAERLELAAGLVGDVVLDIENPDTNPPEGDLR